MTRLEVRTQAKVLADDTALTPGWSTEAWNSFIEAEDKYLYGLCTRLDENWNLTTALIDWVASQETYTIPLGKVVKVQKVNSDSTPAEAIKPIDLPDYDYYNGKFAGNLGPTVFYLAGRTLIGFLPKPTITKSNAAAVLYYPVKPALADDNSESILPSDTHELLALGAAIRAKMSKDLPINELGGMYQLQKQALIEEIKSRSMAGSRHTRYTDII